MPLDYLIDLITFFEKYTLYAMPPDKSLLVRCLIYIQKDVQGNIRQYVAF